MEIKRFYWLDLIRFVAALLVVAVHVRSDFFLTYSQLPTNSQSIATQIFYYLNSFGGEAVIVFFVLSGFLVGGKTVERIYTKKASLGRYAIDRSVRILVPLVSALLLIVAVDSVTGRESQWWCLAGNLFSLQGILVGDAGGVFWTLSYEVWFYVLVAGLIMIFHHSNAVKVGGITVMMLALSCFIALETFYLFILLFGILAYYLSKYELNKKTLWGIVLAWSVTSVLMHFAAPSKARDTSMFAVINLDICRFLLGGGSAVLISQIVRYAPKGRVATTIHDWGSRLSLFSYTLYLTHYQVLRLMHHFECPIQDAVNASGIYIFLLYNLACMVFAYLFYLLSEKHTNAIKAAIYRWLRK